MEDGTVVDLLDRTEITADTLVGVVLDLTEELQLKIKFWNVSLWLLIKLFFFFFFDFFFLSSGSNLLVSDSHRFGKDGPGHNFRAGRCGQAPVVPPEGAKILR